MVIGKIIVCPVCGKITVIHAQAGYLERYSIRFNCGHCGITIIGEYDNGKIMFNNCHEIDSLAYVDYSIQASGDLLTSSLEDVFGQFDFHKSFKTPFIATVDSLGKENFEKYRQRLHDFIEYNSFKFPQLRILMELYENNQFDYLKSKISEISKGKLLADNEPNIYRSLHILKRNFAVNHSPSFLSFSSKVLSLRQDMAKNKTKAFTDMCMYFNDRGLTKKWDNRINQLILQMGDMMIKFMPVMSYDLYAKPNENFEKYAITTTSFEEFESLYLKLYELICDLIPLVIAFDNVYERGCYYRFNNYSLKMKDLIKAKAADKLKLLNSPESFSSLITIDFDNKIRNSIGHFNFENFKVTDPHHQIYRFYKNENNYVDRSLLNLCFDTWKMYLLLYKLEELVYQTRQIKITNDYLKDHNACDYFKKTHEHFELENK